MTASEVVAILLRPKCARGTPSAECSDNYRANLTYNEGSAAHGNDPLLVSKDGLDLAKMSSQRVKDGLDISEDECYRFRAASESESPFSQPT